MAKVHKSRENFEKLLRRIPKCLITWIQYANFELKNGELARCRRVYERAVEALDKKMVPQRLFKEFITFEKLHGDEESQKAAQVHFERFYEAILRIDPLDFAVWSSYMSFEAGMGELQKEREVFERAIANVPARVQETEHDEEQWDQYISLWAYQESVERSKTRRDDEYITKMYWSCLEVFQSRESQFTSISLRAADFEYVRGNGDGARQILENALEKFPGKEIFEKFIHIESDYRNIGGLRKLYDRYLDWGPGKCSIWVEYAGMEEGFGEIERARAVFEQAFAIFLDNEDSVSSVLDEPETLFSEYVSFEIVEAQDEERTRAAYEKWLKYTKYRDAVWVSYANFEANVVDKQNKQSILRAIDILKIAIQHCSEDPEYDDHKTTLLQKLSELEAIGDSL